MIETSAQGSEPLLSIVATSRNDDHGGGLLHRMQVFVDSLLEQCKQHNLEAELLLVEWNPPPDRPALAAALRRPAHPSPCAVRIIQVPPRIHRRFQYSDRLPLFQMIGKNVGIRRAHGNFVLATNIDILFSDELIHFLGSGKLKPKGLYRIDRYDVNSEVPAEASVHQRLEFCERHVIRLNRRNGTVNVKTGHFERVYSPWHFIPPVVDRFLLRRLPARPRKWRLWNEHRRLYSERVRLHTNACGDFTLMAKEHWFALRGYPELQMYSFHLDSLLCYAAHHAGFREKILKDPIRIYHMEHSSGWTPEGEKDGSFEKRLGKLGVPRLSDRQMDIWTVQMRREQRPIIFNQESWGLGDENLPETSIGSPT